MKMMQHYETDGEMNYITVLNMIQNGHLQFDNFYFLCTLVKLFYCLHLFCLSMSLSVNCKAL